MVMKRLPLADLALAALVVVLAYVSPHFIPYNMDEFSHYHVLGCKHAPLSDLHDRFANGCDMYDLKPPGLSTYLPLRSYLYIGVAQTVPFLPFWAAFDDPVAGRVQGALYLLLATFLIARLVDASWRVTLFAMLLFPSFCAPFILDTGPVGVSLCSYLGLLLLIRKGVTSETARSKIWTGIAIGLLAFFAASIKLVFVWVIPTLPLWALWVMRPQDSRQWPATLLRQLPLIFAAGITFVLPTVWLLAALDRQGVPFFAVSATSKIVLTAGNLYAQAYRLGKPIWNSTFFDLRTMMLPGNREFDALPLLIGLAVIAFGLWLKRGADRLQVLLLLAFAGLTFAFIMTNANAWAPHHSVYAMVLIAAAIASCAETLKQRKALLVAAIALSSLYWVSLAVRLPQATIQADTGFDKDELTRFLRTSHLDASTVQVHVDWGTYYLSHTFGDSRQLALTVYGWDTQPSEQRQADLSKIRHIASDLHRDILLITRQTGDPRQDPDVVAVLGQPTGTYPFNTWMITRYGS